MIDYGAKIVITGNAAKTLEQISKASEKMNQAFEKGSRRVAKAGNEITRSMDRVGDSVRRVGSQIRNTFSQTVNDVRKVRSEIDKLKPNFSGWGSKLAGFGLSIGAADVARRVYNAGTSEESTYARLKFALGSDKEAAAMMARLKAIGRNSTSPISQIYQNAGFLAPVFKGETDKYLKLFSEVVAGSGGDFGNIAFNFSQIKQAGRPELEDIKQFAYNNIPIFEELGKVLGVSVQQVRELQSEGKISFDHIAQAFENMTKKGGIYYGALDAQANTFRGKMQIIGNKMQELFVKAFDKARPYLDKFADKLEEIIDNFDEYVPKIKAVGIAIATAFSVNVLAKIISSLNVILNTLKAITAIKFTGLLSGFGSLGGILSKLSGPIAILLAFFSAVNYGHGNASGKGYYAMSLDDLKKERERLIKERDNPIAKDTSNITAEEYANIHRQVANRREDRANAINTNKDNSINAKIAEIDRIIKQKEGISKMKDISKGVDDFNLYGQSNIPSTTNSSKGGSQSKAITINITAPIVQIDSTHIDNKQYTAQQIGEIAAKELVNIMSQVAVQ